MLPSWVNLYGIQNALPQLLKQIWKDLHCTIFYVDVHGPANLFGKSSIINKLFLARKYSKKNVFLLSNNSDNNINNNNNNSFIKMLQNRDHV